MVDRNTKLSTLTVTRVELVEFLGVSRMQINNLERKGHLHPDRGERFNLQKANSEWCNYLKTRKTSQRMADDAKMRALKIEAMEFKNGEKLRKITEEYNKHQTERMWKLRNHVDAVPARYTRDVKERRKLEDMLHEAFDEFTKKLEEEANA